jgi:predicted nucleotidyltransferase
MGALLDERRRDVDDRIAVLRRELVGAAEMSAGRACVYLTGSFGRGEASAHSDLDLFILGTADGEGRRQLSKLDEICLKADLIRAADRLGYPRFSRDGAFLQHHTARDLVLQLGTERDDADNTLTARLLLLLESRPLFGEDVYEHVVSDVIAEYWKEFERHRDDFEPSFLTNDILRLWRTLCLNYEARPDRAREDPKAAAKRKLKNYKLKHSRLLTCFSAVASLLATFVDSRTVTPSDAKAMIRQTPTERIEALSARSDVAASANDVLTAYEDFLRATDGSEDEVLVRLAGSSDEPSRPPGALGDRMFELIDALGKGSPFYRRLLV